MNFNFKKNLPNFPEINYEKENKQTMALPPQKTQVTLGKTQVISVNKQVTVSNKQVTPSKIQLTSINKEITVSNKQISPGKTQVTSVNKQVTVSNKQITVPKGSNHTKK